MTAANVVLVYIHGISSGPAIPTSPVWLFIVIGQAGPQEKYAQKAGRRHGNNNDRHGLGLGKLWRQ